MKRLLGTGAGWALLACASPGILVPEGSACLAVLGLAAWTLGAGEPVGERPRRAFLVEALTAALGWAVIIGWMGYVLPLGVVWTAVGKGLYYASAGLLLRRLARRLPLAVAGAAAFLGIEMLRTLVPPPLGLPWMRLGHHAHGVAWLAASARVWGVGGLGLALALAGSGLAQFVRRTASRIGPADGFAGSRVAGILWGAGGLALAFLLGRATGPPATEPGPRVLLVQPAVPQERKLAHDAVALFEDLRALTLRSVAAEPDVDLVCWGESMLLIPLIEPGVIEALEAGAELAPWSYLARGGSPLENARWGVMAEDSWVRGALFGQGRPGAPRLPEGVSFLTGVEVFAAEEGEIRRYNAVVLYGPDGRRHGFAAKRELVPGAESDLGLSGFAILRDLAQEMGGYVPDLSAAPRTGVLSLETRDGRRFAIAATVCFDNAFEAPYMEPAAGDGDRRIDLHLVVSNEAWYETSQEFDQMVAFSRVIAIATGRSVVRATNSGISLVLAPDGSEVARLRSPDGRDRAVPGTLAARVPVPVAGTRPTVYARSWKLWRGLWLVLPWLLLGGSRVRDGYRSGARE